MPETLGNRVVPFALDPYGIFSATDKAAILAMARASGATVTFYWSTDDKSDASRVEMAWVDFVPRGNDAADQWSLSKPKVMNGTEGVVAVTDGRVVGYNRAGQLATFRDLFEACEILGDSARRPHCGSRRRPR